MTRPQRMIESIEKALRGYELPMYEKERLGEPKRNYYYIFKTSRHHNYYTKFGILMKALC